MQQIKHLVYLERQLRADTGLSALKTRDANTDMFAHSRDQIHLSSVGAIRFQSQTNNPAAPLPTR